MPSLTHVKALVRRLESRSYGRYIIRGFRKMRALNAALSGRLRQQNDHDLIKSSRYFDEKWYRKAYPDVPVTADAVSHYLSSGASTGYNPGPLFDAAWYLSAHPDVGSSGINPLVHFIRWGEREGRAKRSIGAAVGKGDILPLKGNNKVRFPGNIAVVIHAFYADVFDSLCPSLANIPVRFDLYISVPSEDVAAQIRRSLDTHAKNANAVIRVSQNRGRNFGPFLVEFSDDILRHDFILHLHTKKSLYTGAEQASWRAHLYDTLLGDRESVEAILSQFVEHPDLGVIYPMIASSMPYWAHHWLSNAHLAPDMFRRLEVSDYQMEGMIDYPVGGMFWGRVEALRPLFTAQFRYTDFPEEAGQTDGTLAHAIERSIVQVARSRGYGFGEVDPSTWLIRYNWSERNLFQYASQTSDALRTRIQEADLISFDIFDTLLLRPSAAPNSVLKFVGVVVIRQYPSAQDFYQKRKDAELAARQQTNFAGDVDLDAIYAAFPVTDDWPREAIAFAQSTEIGMEKRIVQPRTEGVAAVRYARSVGKRVIAISDTYMSRSLVEELLATVGLAHSFDDIYVSSDRQARKDRGDLWRLVMEREHVQPYRWLHIGDNEHSDVQRPSDLGMMTFHFMNPTALAKLRGFETMLSRGGGSTWGTDLVLGPLVNRVAGSPFLEDGSFRPLTLTTPFDVGYVVFGPIAFTFTAWLIRRLKALDIQRAYFLAREGYSLRRFYETFRRYSEDPSLPESTYLLTSRRMVLSALQGLTFEPEEITGAAYYNGTLAGLLQSRIGLTLPQELGLEEFTIRLPDDSVRALARLQALETEIVAHGKHENLLYQEYCASIGILSEASSAVIDIGYNATIQRVLQKLTERSFAGFYLGSFKGARDVERMGGAAYGCFTEGLAPFASPLPVVQQSLILEAFLCAPHGQVSGFTRGSNGLEPVYKSDSRSSDELSALEELQAGANAYCEELLATYGPAILDVELDLQAVQEPLRLLAERDIKVPAQVSHALAVEDDFTGSGVLVAGKRLVTIPQ